MLVLPIKKKWFGMIKAGEKKEEYRQDKPYYTKRLINYFGNDNGWCTSTERVVIFRNGYGYNVPQIKCLCTLDMGKGKTEWRSRKRQNILHPKDTKSRRNHKEATKEKRKENET